MKYKSSDCFVLKTINYRDADKILTLYSEDEGKIVASARGVRKISSKRSGSLDRLNLVTVSFYQGSSGYNTITEVKSIDSYRKVKDDSALSSIAYKIILLLLRNVEEEAPNKDLFELLGRSLFLLDASMIHPDWVFGHFLLNFMEILGYSMNLSSCVSCGSKLSSSWEKGAFNFEKGGVICSDCIHFEPELDLRTLALLLKLRRLNDNDLKYFKKSSGFTKEVIDLLDTYKDLNL